MVTIKKFLFFTHQEIIRYIITRDEPRIKFGLMVLMRSMCSMLFDVFDGFDVVRCGSMCSMWFNVFDEFHEFDVVR